MWLVECVVLGILHPKGSLLEAVARRAREITATGAHSLFSLSLSLSLSPISLYHYALSETLACLFSFLCISHFGTIPSLFCVCQPPPVATSSVPPLLTPSSLNLPVWQLQLSCG